MPVKSDAWVCASVEGVFKPNKSSLLILMLTISMCELISVVGIYAVPPYFGPCESVCTCKKRYAHCRIALSQFTKALTQ